MLLGISIEIQVVFIEMFENFDKSKVSPTLYGYDVSNLQG